MTEIHGPGGPLPAIPDDLTLVQFMLDYQHPSRPHIAQPGAWLIEDATGRRVTVDEVRLVALTCSNVRKLTLSSYWSDTRARTITSERLQAEVEYRYIEIFLYSCHVTHAAVQSKTT